MERLLMGAPVVHFEIMGGQGNQLEKFYAELFGWKINSNNPMKYGVVDTGGGVGGINGGVGANQDGSKRVSVYAQVNDLQATLDKVEKLGGKTILPPTEVPGGPKLAMFADPAGNVTGLLLGKQGS
jgi:predicted enzyme related to lactoylglutathione lyase